MIIYCRTGKTFRGCMPKLSVNYEEILLLMHGNFKEQNKVLESSIILINYCIIINAYYNYIA
jgi:hypothetical protein